MASDGLLGRNASVRLNPINPAHPPRHFDGLVTELRNEVRAEGGQVCTLVLRPWLWLLSLRENQKIFHNMTVPEILAQIFADYGFPWKSELQQSYPTVEYTVQYLETDLAFCLRLMSEYGINFRFLHRLHAHDLVLFDATDSLPMVPGDRRRYRMADRQHRDRDEHLTDWAYGRCVTTGRVAMTDYNFTAPRRAMATNQSRDVGHAQGDIESFLYPGRYPERGQGDALARTRVEQMAMADGRHHARGDALGLGAGMRVTIHRHPDPAVDGQTFAVLACHHDYASEGYRSGAGGAEGESYRGSYEFLPVDRPIRPRADLARPRVTGPQTAVVVGQGEIDCDQYGRILVLFHWDREGARSMRCRVAQTASGKGWGSIVIPRVGMEVMVEFLDGDPARPMVTGAVYNADNMPPFGLPGKNMVSGMKSNSTPGGGGYNELVFDDTKGNEEVRLHAQYNLNAKVLHCTTWTTQVNETHRIGNDLSTTVGRDETSKVGRHRKGEVGETDMLDVGQTLTITAGTSITLKVGMSSIVMTSDSIVLKAPTVEIKAQQQFTSTAGIASEHQAGLSFDIKGAMVKINS